MPFLFIDALANELITSSNAIGSLEMSYLPIYPHAMNVKFGANLDWTSLDCMKSDQYFTTWNSNLNGINAKDIRELNATNIFEEYRNLIIRESKMLRKILWLKKGCYLQTSREQVWWWNVPISLCILTFSKLTKKGR